MRKRSGKGGNQQPVKLVYVKSVEFEDACVMGEQRHNMSFVIAIRETESKRTENISFSPLDALRLIEQAAWALRRSRIDGAERLGLFFPSLSEIPQASAKFSLVEAQTGAPAHSNDLGGPADPTTVAVPRAVFLHSLRAVTVEPPHQEFILLSLARSTGLIEQFAVEHHDALMLADSIVRNLVKHGSHAAKTVRDAMKENGLR